MFGRKIKLATVLSVMLLIVACGSGGGGGDEPPPPPPPPPGTDCIIAGSTTPAEQDTDNDGLFDCAEVFQHNTNPELEDTDGDGLNDFAELVTFDPGSSLVRRNPLVADLPRISVDLTSVPQIELSFTDSNQTTQSVATSHDQSVSSGTSTSRGTESSRQLAVGHTISVEATRTVGAEVSASPAGVGASTSFEASLSAGLQESETTTTGSTVSWTNEQRQENTSTFSQAEEVSNTIGTNFTGGTMRVTVVVRNDGFLAYDLENLTLTAFIFDPSRPFEMEPIGNLTFSDGTFPTTSITTGSRSQPFNFSLDLTLPQARRLLRDSDNIVIAPATFRLVDIDDRSLLLRDEDVDAQTASIIIDFGIQSNRLETHRVAVNRGNGSRTITAESALNEVLGLQVVEGPGSWIFGSDSSAMQTESGVTSIGGIAMSDDRNQYWYGALNSSSGGSGGGRTAEILNLLREGYSLGDIDLSAGDTLAFVLVSDSDRDALPDRFEAEFGTNPQLLDTDGDTLGDASEIYGNDLSGPPCGLGPGSNFVSNPRLMDSDGDGIDDAAELANCENPSFRVIANAGADQIVNGGMNVTLQAQAEGAFSGQPQFSWRLMSGPPVLVNGEPVTTLQGIQPRFTAPEEVSTLIFTLDVEVDGGMSSDQVTVQVQRDRSAAVYVSNANSGTQDGSINAPFSTLQRAISSLNPGEDLYVMTPIDNGQVQPYTLVSSLEIPDGTNLYGGYNSSWVRDVETQLTPVVMQASVDNQGVFSYQSISTPMELSGFALTSLGGTTSPGDSLVALLVNGGGTGSLSVENNLFMSGDVNVMPTANAGSSYGVQINNLARLEFLNNQVIAGSGGPGIDGANGASGQSGRDGGNANGRTVGRRGAGEPGFNGGAGGTAGFCPLPLGGDGITGEGGNGGRGGSSSGASGSNGGRGTDGSPGAPAGLFGSTGVFSPANGNTGNPGALGSGGGGGAGGNSRGGVTVPTCAFGGAGGGGGEGGTNGLAGTGGTGGGASIGVWLHEVSDSLLLGNTITASSAGGAGNGGIGGNGGSGGNGGNGGVGGRAVVLIVTGVNGGRGGAGGRGGNGGDGSGGAGGPSIGIFVGPNLTPFIEENGITTGQGGNGGARGQLSGTGGDSVGIFDANTNDGAVPVNLNNRFTIGMPGTSGTSGTGGGRDADGCAGEVNCR